MLQPFRQLTLGLVSASVLERRSEARTRTETLPARLTDIYRERVPMLVLNVSRSGLGLKVEEHLMLNFPVLVECERLLIIGSVRHCMRAAQGGYVVGLKIHKIVDTESWEVQQAETFPAARSVSGAGAGC